MWGFIAGLSLGATLLVMVCTGTRMRAAKTAEAIDEIKGLCLEASEVMNRQLTRIIELEQTVESYEEMNAQRAELESEVDACLLLLKECDAELSEHGCHYTELKAFLAGKCSADDVVKLLTPLNPAEVSAP